MLLQSHLTSICLCIYFLSLLFRYCRWTIWSSNRKQPSNLLCVLFLPTHLPWYHFNNEVPSLLCIIKFYHFSSPRHLSHQYIWKLYFLMNFSCQLPYQFSFFLYRKDPWKWGPIQYLFSLPPTPYFFTQHCLKITIIKVNISKLCATSRLSQERTLS